MTLKEMPAFVFSHKHIRSSVICALLTCAMLTAQLLLMKRTPLAVIFDIVIPFTAAVTFGCYAITMAMDRPVILICPPTVYFISLLVNQLIAVEVGVEDTYPIFIFLEIIPFIFFCVSAATDKLKELTRKILKISCILISAVSAVIAVLAAFFDLKLFDINNIKYTFGMICGFFGVFFTYLQMSELLIVSGTERRVRIPKKFRMKAQEDN